MNDCKNLPVAPLDRDILEEILAGRIKALIFRDPRIESLIDPFMVDQELAVECVDEPGKVYGKAFVSEAFTATPEECYTNFGVYCGPVMKFVDLVADFPMIRIYTIKYLELAQ